MRHYNERLAEGTKNIGKISGAISELNQYDTAFRVINALDQFASELVNTKYETVFQLYKVMETISKLDPAKLQDLSKVLEDINNP